MSAEQTTDRPDTAARHDRLVAANYGRMPTRALARALGTTSARVVGTARRLGLVAPVVWTAREEALLRKFYRPGDGAATTALAETTGKLPHQVRQKARKLGLARAKTPRWTADDDAALSILWGRHSDATVARRLGRTVDACKVRATRHLRRSRTDGVQGWTGRALARLFGVDEHKITDQWLAKGWLVARRAPFRAGANHVLIIEEPALLRFLRDHPEEYAWERMDDPSGYYQKIAREASAGLLTIAAAAARVGMSVEGLRRHVRRGWLPAVRASTCGGGGVLYVREPDLAAWKPRRPELVGHRGRGKAGASAGERTAVGNIGTARLGAGAARNVPRMPVDGRGAPKSVNDPRVPENAGNGGKS